MFVSKPSFILLCGVWSMPLVQGHPHKTHHLIRRSSVEDCTKGMVNSLIESLPWNASAVGCFKDGANVEWKYDSYDYLRTESWHKCHWEAAFFAPKSYSYLCHWLYEDNGFELKSDGGWENFGYYARENCRYDNSARKLQCDRMNHEKPSE